MKYITSEDKKSIAQYGLLRSIEKVDTNKENNLKKLADDKLAELNKVKETYEGSMLGDYRISKGKVIKLNIKEYGLIGNYLIKSASHSIDSKKEVVSIILEYFGP